MALRERGHGWQIDVSYTPSGQKKRRVRVHFIGTKADAQIREAEVKAALMRGEDFNAEAVTEDAPVTLRDAFGVCEKRYWAHTASLEQNIRYCREFMDWAGADTPINTLTTRQLDAYVQPLIDKGLASSTINSKVSVISKMLTHYEDELDRKPRVPFQKGRVNKRLRYMSDEEVSEVYQFLRDHWGSTRSKIRRDTPTAVDWHDFFVFYIDTGCRPNEIRSLKKRDLDGDCVHVWHTKSGEARTIPLTAAAKSAFDRQSEIGKVRGGNPFAFATNHAIRAVWDEVRNFMGLQSDTEFVPYVCRHTCATRLYRKTRDLLVVQQWLGHSNINQTLTYAKLFPTALMSARDALEADVVELVYTSDLKSDD